MSIDRTFVYAHESAKIIRIGQIFTELQSSEVADFLRFSPNVVANSALNNFEANVARSFIFEHFNNIKVN
jgi:hypothetical protein